jgi:cysteine desulfurase/selenocysteine lyase
VSQASPPYDIDRVRKDFPVLQTSMRGKPLVYLDTANTAQKPRQVIDAISDFYSFHYSNIHRAVYELSEVATRLHDEARDKVRRLLGAAESREIVFTRNATEAINLVAASYGRSHVGVGDEVLITTMEHHANIVPWQQLCLEKGAQLRVAPIDDRGELLLDDFEKLLSPRTKIVGVVEVSNALGSVNPVREIIRLAHANGTPVLVDGAQAVPRFPVNVAELGCDFYVFSGHKLYGPSGVGALYGRAELLEAMPPYQTGGDMILSVSFAKTVFNEIPHKFEAGTPDLAGAVGLGAAIDYVTDLGLDRIARHEEALLAYGSQLLSEIPEVRMIGTARRRSGVLSFVVDGVHPHDVGTVLDQEGIAVRAGHHCAQPVMERFGLPATVRASLGLYSDRSDLERLSDGLRKVVELFR